MKKTIAIVSLVCATAFAVYHGGIFEKKAPVKNEFWYRDRLAETVRGITEAVVWKGRVDVMTSNAVYELDFIHKHHECLGQALWYGWCTKKQPIMALIVPLGDWIAFTEIKAFVQSNSNVKVVAIDAGSGNLMAEY